MSDLLKEQYMAAGISEDVYDFCESIADSLKERFEKKKKFYRKMLDIFLLMQYYSQAH